MTIMKQVSQTIDPQWGEEKRRWEKKKLEMGAGQALSGMILSALLRARGRARGLRVKKLIDDRQQSWLSMSMSLSMSLSWLMRSPRIQDTRWSRSTALARVSHTPPIARLKREPLRTVTTLRIHTYKSSSNLQLQT